MKQELKYKMKTSKDDGITIMAKNGKCSRCGECCGIFLPLTKKEVKVMKEYVFKNHIVPEKRIFGVNHIEMRCPFLDLKEHKCKIYPARPYVCRDFICSRKNWKEKRDFYKKRADYNSYTVDELIYGKGSFFELFLLSQLQEAGKEINEENVKKLLYFLDRKKDSDKICNKIFKK